MELLQAIITLLSIITAILAWIAKLRWSKEYSAAKDETIRAKEAQIQVLEREIKSYQEMTPMKIREYFLSTKEQLEEYNNDLITKLDGARNKITSLESEYQKIDDQNQKEKKRLKQEIEDLRNQIASLETKQVSSTDTYEQLTSASGTVDKFINIFNFINSENFDSVIQTEEEREKQRRLRFGILGYTWEKLYNAVRIMAWNEKKRPGRLLDAVTHNVGSILLAPDYQELPNEFKTRLDTLQKQLTKHTSYEESIRRMEDSEVENAIEEIVSIYDEITKAYERSKL